MKYDDLNLPFLKKVFEKIEAEEIEKFINASPSGKYARRIGFLFELLTGRQLAIRESITSKQRYISQMQKRAVF